MVALLVAEVPPLVVTLIDATPTPPGETTVIVFPSELTDTLAIRVEPKLTVALGVKPFPLMVTLVPPLALPDLGLIPVTTGIYEKAVFPLVGEVPALSVTVTCTVPDPPGAVAVIEVPDEPTLTLVPGTPPNETVESDVNPAPEIVTTVPPVAGPELGLIPVTTGIYENSPAITALPPGGVTVTCTVPDPPGAVAVIEVP